MIQLKLEKTSDEIIRQLKQIAKGSHMSKWYKIHLKVLFLIQNIPTVIEHYQKGCLQYCTIKSHG